MITNLADVQIYPCLDDRPIKPCSILIPEIFNIICGALDIKSLGRLSLVSREWHKLSAHDAIWKRFENEFKVQSPQIKSKIHHSETSLNAVYDEIKNKMYSENDAFRNPSYSNFYIRFLNILFGENVTSIRVKKGLATPQFTLKLHNNRQIHFSNYHLSNITLPKKVFFDVAHYHIKFYNSKEFHIEINRHPFINVNTHLLRSLHVDHNKDLKIVYNENSIFNRNDDILQTRPHTLNSFLTPSSVKEW